MTTAIVDEYADAALENDEIFSCKRCGEILEEGKAFELAGLRWHLNCFRCHSCDTLLDSDANLLLLGGGALICNNCTYTCNACGNKIEDLAILTGDQAFCSTCFRCRNCKRKIENLRYARTSQGIFCMGCHETIMARRRKRTKAAAAAKTRDRDESPITEKSLPALPPTIAPISTDHPDADLKTTPTSTSPRSHTLASRSNTASRIASISAAPSPERLPPDNGTPVNNDNLTLPASTYRKNRNSTILSASSPSTNQFDSHDGFYISVALDQNPSADGSRKLSQETAGSDVSRRLNADTDRLAVSPSSTPHIAFHEKGRQQSTDHITQAMAPSRKLSNMDKDWSKAPPDMDESRQPEASRGKRLAALRTNSSQLMDSKQANGASRARLSQDSRFSPDNDESMASQDNRSSRPSISRKELPTSSSRTCKQSPQETSLDLILADLAVGNTTPVPEKSNNESYMQPRAAPLPPGGGRSSVSGNGNGNGKYDGQSPKLSPSLPTWTSRADHALNEEMARILGTDEGSSLLLRRVSNAVRNGRTGSIESSHNPRLSHSRSISETTRSTLSPPRSRTQHGDDHSAHDMSSPIPYNKVEDSALLKRQLRNSEQRVAELERQFHTEKNLQNLDKKLVEKRKTVSVLDTQAEIMIRQLEVLAGYVEKAKETKAAIDVRELEDSAVKDFVKKLERVKEAMSSEIEQLHEQRDKLLEERSLAMANRDRALMEFEQLSSKNAQLADMNNEMTHQIQERFKSQVGDARPSNGLGIYGQRASAASSNLDAVSLSTNTTLVPGEEEHIVESGPTVVQVRKGQAKKFNWKKGSKTMAQNVAKGVNRAVVAFQQNERERPGQMGGATPGGLNADNIGLPYNMTVTQSDMTSSMNAGGPNAANKQQSFGFFGKKPMVPKSTSTNTLNMMSAAEPATTLFGSDLTERADYERRQIPSIVTRCIEEVELRGMDQEGIYRKTGGNSQINQIKEGFEKSENFDISDPDMDITAVTSVLKQYFRKLPLPLFTFDVYDRVLESNAVADEMERCSQLRKTFDSMPQSHRDCLEFLMFHLQRVAQREPENLMSPKNLAVVFAPTLMRDLSIEREMTDMHAKNIAVQFVIENSHLIFEDV